MSREDRFVFAVILLNFIYIIVALAMLTSSVDEIKAKLSTISIPDEPAVKVLPREKQ